MKTLLLILLVGCGLDPDDYKAKKSEGCPSNGCEPIAPAAPEPAPVAKAKPEPEPEPEPVVPRKIHRGMTPDQLLKLVGEPDSVSVGYSRTVWQWREDAGFTRMCILKYEYIPNDCEVQFLRGVVVKWTNIKGKWIDLTGS